MSNRNYNVFFNTHTVSGIVISIVLYVIFFAGAFTLFKGEIQIWEEGNSLSYTKRKDIDYDQLFKKLDEQYELTGRDLIIKLNGHSDHIYFFMRPSKDSLASKKGKLPHYLYTNITTGETKTYQAQYSLGEFLYRLHFFHQLPYIGIYLAGFVALFFLFAIVTGVIVHWKKIIPNFYAFNPKVMLKRVWADAHTALGIIGLPFQFIFSVTGAYFAIGLFVLIPANFLYNGNKGKLMEDLRPARKSYKWEAKSEKELLSFNKFAKYIANQWENFHLVRAFVKNYGGTNMKYILIGEMKDKQRFTGIGRISFNANTGAIEAVKNPNDASYKENFQRTISRLHFADYGGTPIKIIYFVLALITCFVIITGVLIWIEARNKRSMSLRQRLYTAKVGHIYLAVCLSLFPVISLAFLFVKLSTGVFENKQSAIYYFFFITWLAFTLFFRFKRSNYLTNKWCLLLGSIFGFLVPVSNGIVSGKWIWITFTSGQFDIMLIDLLWIIISTTALFVYLKIKPEVKKQSGFNKTPIDYKNIKTLLKEEVETRKKKQFLKNKPI